jgi:alkane 1-monooxygenase
MLALMYPALCVMALYFGGWWVWIGLPFNLILVPLADTLFGKWDTSGNERQERWRMLIRSPWPQITGLAHLSVLMLLICRLRDGSSIGELLGYASTFGIAGGCLAITVAHELIHRRSRSDRALGLCLLVSVSYPHFRIEHIHGHHRNAATYDDPGTARRGESFGAYFARALRVGPRNAWHYERLRLQRQGRSMWNLRNRMLQYALVLACVYTAALTVAGWMGAASMRLQSFVALHLQEASNYVQHYGLGRSRKEGLFERFGPGHAWDSPYRFSSLLLFNLPLHTGHHMAPDRACGDLSLIPGAKILPASFYLMVFAALFPPVWRKVMDHRL